MKKTKHALWPLVALVVALAMLGGCASAPMAPAEPEPAATAEPVDTKITFENGNHQFLTLLEHQPDADVSALSLADVNDAKAVRLTPAGTGVPHLAMDVSSLIGEALPDLRTIVLTVAVEGPSDQFYAVSGEIALYNGIGNAVAKDAWSVYLPTKNPNLAQVQIDGTGDQPLDPAAFTYLVLTKKTDNAIVAGQAPRNLLISSIQFLDKDGTPLNFDPDAKFNAPEGFDEADRTNLVAVGNDQSIQGASGESSGWGQAVALTTLKNEGVLDPALLVPGSIVTVMYESAAPPELIAQSWTDGAPESASWAKVAPAAVNDSGTTAQFMYADIVAAFGTDDLETYLDQLFVGDTGESLSVNSVSIGMVD